MSILSVPTIAPERELLEEASFLKALCLERKRTERSRRPFLLMLLDLTTFLSNDVTGKHCDDLLSTLSSSIRETDVIGWYSQRRILGVIFTEIQSDGGRAISNLLSARINGLLYSKLNFDRFREIKLSQYLFPEDWEYDVPQRASHPTLYPDLSERQTSGRLFSVSKRAIDVFGSAIGLLIGLPLFVVIGLAIKLTSKGPILFRQVRVGQYGKPFVFLKFRSMVVDNDPSIHREFVKALINGQAHREQATGNDQGVYKLTRDRRVTRIGMLLRKSSLDELPQLCNVLRGEMSLVGPRPAIPYEVESYELWHRRRVLEAKPGITGLWQVKGRSSVTFDEMVRLDVRYAMARSIWLDLKILLQTPSAVILGTGAY